MCMFSGKVIEVKTKLGAWYAGIDPDSGLPLQGIVYKNSFTPEGKPAQTQMMRSTRSGSGLPLSNQRSSAENLLRWEDFGYSPVPYKSSGLAMIWPIPINLEANVLTDVSFIKNCAGLVDDMTAPFEMDDGSRGGEKGITRSFGAAIIVAHGDYQVVIADRPTAALNVIDGVSDDKRPDLKSETLKKLEAWYPGWALVIACINADKAVDADPFALVFPTRHPDLIYLPTLDDHTGQGPDLAARVDLSHRYAVGSVDTPSGKGHSVYYSDDYPEAVMRQLPRRVLGGNFHKQITNGDFYFYRKDVEAGTLNAVRKCPPGVVV